MLQSLNIILPFIAVWFGFVAVKILKQPLQARMKLLLAFSGAFLLSIVAFEVFPEVYDMGGKMAGLWLVCGIFIQMLLEFFSRGAEHGHMHVHKGESLPIGLFIALAVHAILEGTTIPMTDGLLWGIVVHKLPVAVIFCGFLVHSGMKMTNVILLTFIFSIMTPLGTLLSQNIAFEESTIMAVEAIVAGLMLHVSSTLILESSENHRFNFTKVLVMLIAVGLAWIV